jgi:hypothetical protein
MLPDIQKQRILYQHLFSIEETDDDFLSVMPEISTHISPVVVPVSRYLDRVANP